MSGFPHDVASAALGVALVLMVAAAAAGAVLWARVEDADIHALAREYLAPLATWGLGFAGVCAAAHLLAGDALRTLGLPLGLAAAAALLLATTGEPRPAEPAREEPAAGPEPAPTSLWAHHGY
jgi:hypothetical protein